MPLFDYRCDKGHEFESFRGPDDRYIPCEHARCKAQAERQWLPKRRSLLTDPIVLHRYADGTWGVPGRADAKTPKGAERIEIRSMAEYTRALGRMNGEERQRAERRHEAVQAARERLIAGGRADLIEQMNRESDPLAKDIMREALARNPTAYQPFQFRETFSEAMEYNSSGRDGGWEAGRGNTRK